VYTYLTVSIAKCLRLLIGNFWINRIVVLKVFGVSGLGLCGLVFLVLGGSLAGTARWICTCGIARFTFQGHDIVGIGHFCRQTRCASRSTCGQRDLGNKGIKGRRRKLALIRQGCRHWGNGRIVIRVVVLRSKGLKDATYVGWFGDDWDCSVGCPPEAMIT